MSREDAFKAYQDSEGEPQFAESAVLFWDVIGVQAMSESEDRLDNLKGLRRALARAREYAGTEDGDEAHASTWFTDNVVVATPILHYQDEEMILGGTAINVAYMNLALLEEGFLAAGAITYGEHYMEATFVFGPAIIEAVRLEKEDDWPRVVLSPRAADENREAIRRWYGSTLPKPHGRRADLRRGRHRFRQSPRALALRGDEAEGRGALASSL